MYECHTVLLTPSQEGGHSKNFLDRDIHQWKRFSRWTITQAKCEYSKIQPRVMYNDTWGIYENEKWLDEIT